MFDIALAVVGWLVCVSLLVITWWLMWPHEARRRAQERREAATRRAVDAAYDDVLVTYADVRSGLPPSIRDSFHPDWPWFDPADVPPAKPPQSRLAAEIRNLGDGDQEFLQP